MVITFVMVGYEGHGFSNSLIRNIYVTTPGGPKSTPSTNLHESNRQLRGTLATKAQFHFGYFEALWTSILTSLCCCLRQRQCYKKRVKRQKLFVDANERLAKELNLHTLLNTVRLTDFIAELLQLKAH